MFNKYTYVSLCNMHENNNAVTFSECCDNTSLIVCRDSIGLTTLSGNGKGVGRHIMLSGCVSFVHATGIGQLPSCVVQCLMCVGVTTLVFVAGVTTLWDSARQLPMHSTSREMRADDAADRSQLLS